MSACVYLNGCFVPYEQALIPVEDRGNLFADGIYEVVRYLNGKPFEWRKHLDRLEASAAALALPLPLDDSTRSIGRGVGFAVALG